jgi:peptidyl-prolyl cis-trans isomerase SurA
MKLNFSKSTNYPTIMSVYRSFLAFIIILIIGNDFAYSQRMQVADQIIATVNNKIILKSDIDSLSRMYMKETRQPFSDKLWYSLLNAEIEKFMLIEQAKIDSVVVTDDEVDRKLNQRIRMMVRQAGSEEVLENYFGKSLIELRVEWKRLLKDDELVNKVRMTKMNGITITRPEVFSYYKEFPQDSIPTLPERVKLAHIVRIPKPNQNAKKEAFNKASAIRDSVLNHGKTLEEMAKLYSDDTSAPNGGALPLIDIAELVPEYSAAAAALSIGGISQVVETTYGYHVIRLNKRVGDQIETNHVLIKIDSENVDEESEINKLTSIRDSLLTNKKFSFTTFARSLSEDKSTSASGGLLKNPQTGQPYLELNSIDPALYRIVLLLEKEGDISEPKPFTTNPPGSKKAYRIVQLLERIEEHKANLELDYDLFMNIALQQKKESFFRNWINSIKKDFYIEYKVQIPKEYQL